MTLTLELPANVEAPLLAAAELRGETLESLFLEWAEREAARLEKESAQKRKVAAEAALGMFAGRGRTVDEFLADRHAEGEAEFDKWHNDQLK